MVKGMKYHITARGVTDVVIFSGSDEINNPIWRFEGGVNHDTMAGDRTAGTSLIFLILYRCFY